MRHEHKLRLFQRVYLLRYYVKQYGILGPTIIFTRKVDIIKGI